MWYVAKCQLVDKVVDSYINVEWRKKNARTSEKDDQLKTTMYSGVQSAHIVVHTMCSKLALKSCADPEGGPPEKSQKYRVF